jgi:hypothetical protein
VGFFDQLIPKLDVVEYFAVEGNPELVVRDGHGLVPAFRVINA